MTTTRYFEEIRTGEQTVLGVYEFTAGNIKDFARAYDPQPFHVDEEAARRSHFGSLCASGWHTCAAFMKTLANHHLKIRQASELAPGRRWPLAGPAKGITDLRWPRPVRPGDVVTFSQRVLEKTEIASRPAWGLVSCRNEGVNQRGEQVFSCVNHVLHERIAG